MPPEFVSRLFGKFARADTPATKAQRGIGLGLSIVRGLAEANGGEAHYEPNVPNGSCFVVELPQVTCQAREGAVGDEDPPFAAAQPHERNEGIGSTAA